MANGAFPLLGIWSRGFAGGLCATAALIGAQSASGLPVIEAAIVSAGAAYRDRDGFAVPLVAILASGVRG